MSALLRSVQRSCRPTLVLSRIGTANSASRAVSASRSGGGGSAIVNGTARRGFRWTTCRKEQYLDADKATFDRAVFGEKSKGKVVLVDFYANWCGPCKMLSPILERLTAPSSETVQTQTGSGCSVDLVTVDTDVEPELAMEYNVRSLPTVLAFKDGKVVSQFVGAIPEPHVKRFLSQL